MKTLHLVETERYNRRNVLIGTPEAPGALSINTQNGNLALSRARCRVMDVLEAAPAGPVTIEDADHAVLVVAIEEFPLGVNDRALLALLESALTPV